MRLGFEELLKLKAEIVGLGMVYDGKKFVIRDGMSAFLNIHV